MGENLIMKGERAFTRHGRDLNALVMSEDGEYAVLVRDMSRIGARFVPAGAAVQDMAESEDVLNEVGLEIASRFGERFQLSFPEHSVSIGCELVRLGATNGAAGTLYFGARFTRALSDAECRSLGLVSTPHDAFVAPGSRNAAPQPAPAPAAAAERAAPPVDASSVRLDDSGPAVTIDDLLRMSVERRASDVHLRVGGPVRMRIDGSLGPVGDHRLSNEEADGFVRAMLTDEQFDRYIDEGDLDVSYSLPGVARFRVNVLRAQGETGLAIRRIPEEVPPFASLGLSPVCLQLAERPNGLVLVTGPTGSGKSTTLAAMVQHINATRACHILTMEDPTEYLHPEDKAQITQREIGKDTRDFTSALRRALRQDPDVILVGEMRDLETIALAVTAAETGHLVFATLHTTSAVSTVDRIVDVFPPEQQRQIRMQLADCLQAILSQIMLPRLGGPGVAVAQEILVANDGVRALIRDGKTPQIGNMMQTGAKAGMQTLEDSLNRLVAGGIVSENVARLRANNPSLIEARGQRRTPRRRQS